MRLLVVFYSKTGNTMRVGRDIAHTLKADEDRIIDKKELKGPLGYAMGGFAAIFGKETEILFEKDPSTYDIIAIGSPVWAGRIPPAVRAYMRKNRFGKVAFFSTKGGSNASIFPSMEKLSKKPLCTLEVLEKKIPDSKKEINDFCARIIAASKK